MPDETRQSLPDQGVRAGIWACKIGECDWNEVPDGGDMPMRDAIQRAFERVTGKPVTFIFSGWSAQLDEGERAVVEDRLPDRSKVTREVPYDLVDDLRAENEALKAERARCQHCPASTPADERSFMCEDCAGKADEEVQNLRDEVERLREALDEIVDDLSVPSRPAPWAAHALQVAQMAAASDEIQADG